MAKQHWLTKDRVKITLSNMPGDWDTCTDPSSSREVESLKPAADKPKRKSGGAELEYEDITVTRFWEANEAVNAGLLKQWHADPSFFDDGTLSLAHLGIDKLPMGTPDTYQYIVKDMGKTGADANAPEKVKLTVVLSVWKD